MKALLFLILLAGTALAHCERYTVQPTYFPNCGWMFRTECTWLNYPTAGSTLYEGQVSMERPCPNHVGPWPSAFWASYNTAARDYWITLWNNAVAECYRGCQ